MPLAPAGVHYSGVSVALWRVLSALLQDGVRVLLRTRLLSGSPLGKPALLFPSLHPKLTLLYDSGRTFSSPFFL
jgi:hypothetical protein